MTSNVRVFKTEASAKAADKALAKAGFSDRTAFFASQVKGKERIVVEKAIENGLISERTINACIKALADGKSIVSVNAPFGTAVDAVKIMEGVKGVDKDSIGRYLPSDPAPFSAAFGLPVLSKASPTSMLARSDWTFSSLLGFGLLSNKAAPLSSLFSLPLLTARKKNRKSSFGLPLLSSTAAPLSSLFGMATVTKRKKSKDYSFGLPLLSRNSAPLSNLFGINTLSKDQ